MNDEAESSRAGLRRGNNEAEEADTHHAIAFNNHEQEEQDTRERERFAKERRLDAKRKRIRLLDDLRRELDLVVFMELLTIYHLDGSFFWLLIRAFIHASLLIPIPDRNLDRPPDEPKPFLPLILLSFALHFFLHLVYPAPSAGEDTRGFLHGGLVIDFIGQQGPSSKWKLLGLDTCIMFTQLVMASVHVKRRELKKKLAQASGSTSSESTSTPGATNTSGAQEQLPRSARSNAAEVSNENAARGQDADSEERGVLRRTDTLSDIAADLDEEDSLLPPSDSDHVDALDLLTAGQCVIGEFTLIDTLVQDYKEYKDLRQLQSTSGSPAAFSSDTLRQMQAIRMRFGVGGG